jgi:hypothetical protein
MAIDRASEEWRRKCEARYWLKRTKSDQGRIEGVLSRIAAKRGKAGAELLRKDMMEVMFARNKRATADLFD